VKTILAELPSWSKKKEKGPKWHLGSYDICKKTKQSSWFDKKYFLFMVSKKIYLYCTKIKSENHMDPG